MDAFALTKIFGKKENFTSTNKMTFAQSLMLVLGLTISAYASYLAWNCSVDDHMFSRIFTTILAWFFGVIYILWFVVFKSGTCKNLLTR